MASNLEPRVVWMTANSSALARTLRYSTAPQLEFEAVVGKQRLGSPYRDGKRSADWFKVNRPDAVPPERLKR